MSGRLRRASDARRYVAGQVVLELGLELLARDGGAGHHLLGVHTGTLGATEERRPAPWTIGTKAVMTVCGRNQIPVPYASVPTCGCN